MKTYTINLFKEICKRGCIIKANPRYYTDFLPKCLISVHNDFSYEFTISAITNLPAPYGKLIYFYKYPDIHESSDNYGYKVLIFINGLFHHFFFIANKSWENDMMQLDILTHYLHIFTNKLNLHTKPTNDVLSEYKINLKNKMIQNLIELYMEKFMYLTFADNILSILEIKVVIVEALIKLDKWFDVID